MERMRQTSHQQGLIFNLLRKTKHLLVLQKGSSIRLSSFSFLFFSKGMISNPSPLVNMGKALDKDGKKKEKQT